MFSNLKGQNNISKTHLDRPIPIPFFFFNILYNSIYNIYIFKTLSYKLNISTILLVY